MAGPSSPVVIRFHTTINSFSFNGGNNMKKQTFKFQLFLPKTAPIFFWQRGVSRVESPARGKTITSRDITKTRLVHTSGCYCLFLATLLQTSPISPNFNCSVRPDWPLIDIANWSIIQSTTYGTTIVPLCPSGHWVNYIAVRLSGLFII
jgi:hypothetical protein